MDHNLNRRLSDVMRSLRQQRRVAFIPYITAGDPTLNATRLYLASLESAGADIVELGVPFSDPIADGPVIQRAAERALRSKTTLARILDFVGRYRRDGGKVPIVLFSYFNPILRFGLEKFAREAKNCGVNGVLVVDLPPEEAGEYRRCMTRHGVETVFLASPTTAVSRLRLIERSSTGFVYYVSRLGVTGKHKKLSNTLASELKRVQRTVRKPIAVGFGISSPEQARAVARHADAVVVGSALVQLAEGRKPQEASRRIHAMAGAMVRAIRGIK